MSRVVSVCLGKVVTEFSLKSSAVSTEQPSRAVSNASAISVRRETWFILRGTFSPCGVIVFSDSPGHGFAPARGNQRKRGAGCPKATGNAAPRG